ncbi:DUF1800 domain-containing protein [Deinococcus aerophilus]|uniref:DUF1800 domain-containing protein n=1 Tax=Deinococcus aerophilus TaxID=522488 RepID=A0ABQ2GU60_9DEIO|nr:DUF1800 domain-containing protein [Deinococcus aerophilus]GGM13558.1 hypothetical protein GCM10010841_22710 [Deinococcus aerophilus]
MSLPPHPRPLTSEDAAHFLRRTAFGATDAQIRALVGKNPRDVAREALRFDSRTAPGNPFDPSTGATPGAMLQLTRAAWLYELMYSPQPLRERLALTWSNHFVVGTDKVKNHPALAGYLGLLRRHAATPSFERFTLEVAQSPAMLRYLDNDLNRRGRPNENFARELLELFTVGIGTPGRPNYTEQDVREGARALTGWSFEGGRGNPRNTYLQTPRASFNPRQHDDGQKTYLGQTGRLGFEDVVHLAATHPQTAVFVSRKLHRTFLADTPDEAAVQGSAETFRRTGGNVGAVLEELLSSAAFYAPHSRARIIRGPVEYIVSAVRTLGGPKLEAKQLLNLAQTAGRMGQLLLQPDTVKGWDGGREWINDSALLTRLQVAAALSLGGTAPTLDAVPSDLALFGSETGPAQAALKGLNPKQRVYLALISPEFQLA